METIHRYPNRKLYHMETKSYIAFPQVMDLVKANQDFRVLDSVTLKDVTNQTLSSMVIKENREALNSLKKETLLNILKGNRGFIHD